VHITPKYLFDHPKLHINRRGLRARVFPDPVSALRGPLTTGTARSDAPEREKPAGLSLLLFPVHCFPFQHLDRRHPNLCDVITDWFV
jgi:hypothetical protein